MTVNGLIYSKLYYFLYSVGNRLVAASLVVTVYIRRLVAFDFTFSPNDTPANISIQLLCNNVIIIYAISMYIAAIKYFRLDFFGMRI